MLGHSSNAFDLVGILDKECLDAAVVEYVPKLHHSFRVSCDKAVEVGQDIDADKRVLMAIQHHNSSAQVWVPYEDVEFESTADQYLVLLAVSHLTDGPSVPLESHNRRHCHIAVHVLSVGLILEVGCYLALRLLVTLVFAVCVGLAGLDVV